MLHRRQAPGRDIHRHFSLAPARSHTKPPSNPQSAPAPSPLQRQGPSSLREVESTTPVTHSSHSAPPQAAKQARQSKPHSKQQSKRYKANSTATATRPTHLKPRMGTDGEGRRNSARLCTTAVRRSSSPPLGHRTREHRQLVSSAWQKTGPSDAGGFKGHALISTTSPLSPIPRLMPLSMGPGSDPDVPP